MDQESVHRLFVCLFVFLQLCDGANDKRRRQVQTVYWKACDTLVRLWAPFLVYTTEEIWQHFNDESETSVHYTHFPEVENYENAATLQEKFGRLLEVRSTVLKSLEEARTEKLIASAQEALVTLHCSEADQELLEKTLPNTVSQWLIVSKVEFENATETKAVISKAPGTKCPRCWNYSETPDENDLCPRCHRVMNEQ